MTFVRVAARAGSGTKSQPGRCIVDAMSGGPDTRRGEGASGDAKRRNNPMNRLVPYLDLFARLEDDELARLASVEVEMVATLRRQVNEIGEGLAHYLDLLPRLGDDELVRLSGASIKTIRFWRLCQPRTTPKPTSTTSEISSVTPMPRPMPRQSSGPKAQSGTPRPAAASESGTRRRTTGVPTQPAPMPEQPVADWSSEAPSTNARTTITPGPHPLPRGAWDTTSPTSGTATMITPVGQTPDVAWQAEPPPSLTSTQAGVRAPERTLPSLDPAESQHSAAQLMNFDGEPFPGYEEWRPALASSADEDADFTVELDR